MSLVLKDVSYSYIGNIKKYKSQETAPSVQSHGKPTWGWTDGEQAISNISLELHNDEFLGIGGHTGSGKSTLAQIMAGLIKPNCGAVTLNGANLYDKRTARSLRGKIGLVFQYPEHQLFASTVAQDIAFGPRNLGVAEAEIDNHVNEALALVNLPESIKDTSPFALSGGQQRRVAFAGILAMKPEILILDEPMAGLDPSSRNNFSQIISKLHQQGISICMVSHSMNDLATLCERIIILNNGQLYMEGTPLEVFSQEDALEQVGLSVPPAQKIACALRARGINIPNELYTAKSLAKAIATTLETRQS
jgi:energy-coupling factor transport system ATP-binding protein